MSLSGETVFLKNIKKISNYFQTRQKNMLCPEYRLHFFFFFLKQGRKRSLVHFTMVCSRSGKPVCAPPCLSEVSPVLPLKQFQCSSDFWSLERNLFLRYSPPGERQCNVLGFVFTGCVSNASALYKKLVNQNSTRVRPAA